LTGLGTNCNFEHIPLGTRTLQQRTQERKKKGEKGTIDYDHGKPFVAVDKKMMGSWGGFHSKQKK